MKFAYLKVLEECFNFETGPPINISFGVVDSVMTIKVAGRMATTTTLLDMKVLGPTSTVLDLGDIDFGVSRNFAELESRVMRKNFDVLIDRDGDYITIDTSDGPIKLTNKMGTWVYEPPGRCYELALEMKAEEGFDIGNLFYGMKTAEWVDHAEEHPTTGVTDSEDDNTIRAGVSMLPPKCDDDMSTSDEEGKIPDEGSRENRTNDDEELDSVSNEFLLLGQALEHVHVFDVPLAYRRIRRACVAREPFRRLDNDNPPNGGNVIGSGSATRFPVDGAKLETMEDIIEPDGLDSMGPTPGEPPTDCAASAGAGTAYTNLDATRDSDLGTSGEACENQPNKLWIATWRTGVGDDGVGSLKRNIFQKE